MERRTQDTPSSGRIRRGGDRLEGPSRDYHLVCDPCLQVLRARAVRRRSLSFVAALLLIVAAVIPWSVGSRTELSERKSPVLTKGVFLAAIRSGEVPDGLELPAFYGNPIVIASWKQSAFATPSPLVKMWLQLRPSEKVEVLGLVIESRDVRWLWAFLGEVAYSAIAMESNVAVADQIRSAVLATAVSYAPAAIFLLEHIEQVCPHDTVRNDAGEDARDLRDRVGHLGH